MKYELHNRWIHITDPPVIIADNNEHLRPYGSIMGRFIFTDKSFRQLKVGSAMNVIVDGFLFTGGNPAIEIS